MEDGRGAQVDGMIKIVIHSQTGTQVAGAYSYPILYMLYDDVTTVTRWTSTLNSTLLLSLTYKILLRITSLSKKVFIIMISTLSSWLFNMRKCRFLLFLLSEWHEVCLSSEHEKKALAKNSGIWCIIVDFELYILLGEPGRRSGMPSRRPWQAPEHDGLLGKGSFPKPSGFGAGTSAPRPQSNDPHQLSRTNEPYHPPRPYKVKYPNICCSHIK